MLSRIRASIAGRSSGRQRPRQQEVVVEPVVDDRADAELRAREQVQDGLGQDVGGAVAHRPELAGRAVVHELVGVAPLGRVGSASSRSSTSSPSPGGLCLSRSCRLLRESRNPSSSGWTRGLLPRSHRPSPPPEGDVRSCRRANGRRPDRFTDRSRVVPVLGSTAGLPALAPGSLWSSGSDGACPARRFYQFDVVVGDTGLEPVTSCMSSKCSNQLS